MPSCNPPARRIHRVRPARAQRGVVMVITLIALLILLIGGVALIRSMDTSLLLAGNLAFKRDLVNQGERGMAKVISLLTAGALATETSREANNLANNYSAVGLASDPRTGVPTVLLDSAAYGAAGMVAADLVDTTAGVTIRYVVDRQCNAAGTFDASTCMTAQTAKDKSGTNWIKRAGGENRPIYRVSVKVIGPRRTEAYLQSTFVL